MTLGSRDLIAGAWREAEAAAASAGVVIRTVATSAEAREVSSLLAEIWPLPNGASQVEPNFAWALAHSGNYVSLARAADGSRALGACVAFFGPPLQRHAHSHIAGVVAGSAGGGIGLALKLHQRAWSLERDVHDIGWTFDPLISRNAHFNLARLGAVVTEYLPDFYGPMTDARNGGQSSDRLLVSWPLDRTGARAGAAGEHPGLVLVADGAPSIVPDAPAILEAGSTASLLIPDDFEALRDADPAGAARWRAVVGEALSMALGGGRWRITGFHRGTGYLMEKKI